MGYYKIGFGFKFVVLALLKVVVVVVAAAAALQVPSSQLTINAGSKFNASHFDSTITAFMQERAIPGLSVAVTYDDRLIYASGFGYADVANKEPVATTDRFRLASVSKSITAIAIMHLAEIGALSISDHVFGPGGILGHMYGREPYSAMVLNITVQHLLEHASGFVDGDMCGNDCDPTYLPEFLELDQWELVGALLDRYDPSHEPGTFASYSNFGYFILGRAVEAASGVYPYEKYVREQVLSKMKVNDMRIANDKRRKHEVVYYDEHDPKAPYQFHVERRDSVGAWIATPTDLVRIAAAIDGLSRIHNFLNKTTRASMYKKTTVEGSDFAKGWTVTLDEKAVPREACKAGDYSGTNSILEINFVDKTAFAIVVNREIPRNENFNGGADLKTLMDGLIEGVDEWPDYDLFEENR